MGRLRLLVCLALAGCIKPATEVACGDLICPETSVCLASGQCVPQADVAACNGLADGAACTTDEFSGTCVGGACISPVCGDAIVEGTEQCDGSVPTGLDCVYYGFDLGLPTCDSCVIDVVDPCVRFGWTLVLSEAVSGAWTNGARLAVVRRDNTGVDVYAAQKLVTSVDDTQLYNVTGNITSTIAWGPYELTESDNGGTFAPLDTSALSLSSVAAGIGAVQIDETGKIYLTTSNTAGCLVYAHPASGTWTVIGTFANETCEVLRYGNGTLVLGTHSSTADTVQQYTGAGATWTTLFTPPDQIDSIELHAGSIYVGTFTQAIVWNGGIQATFANAGAAELVPLDNGLYAGGGGGNSVTRYVGATGYEALDAPIGGSLITDGTSMFIIGNGVYVYSGTQYASRSNPEQSATVTDLTMLGDGNVAMVTFANIVFEEAANTFYWTYILDQPNPNPVAIAGASLADFYVTDGVNLQHGVNSTFTNPNLTAVTMPAGTTGIADLWVPPSGQIALIAAGAKTIALKRGTTTWISITPPPSSASTCAVTALAGDATPQLFAAVTCDTSGEVWQLVAGSTQWTLLQHDDLPAAAIALDPAGDIFVVGAMGGASQIAAGPWTIDAQLAGLSVSATSPTDIWTGDHASVRHFDGASWSRLGVVGADSPRVLATQRAIYISGVTNPVLLR